MAKKITILVAAHQIIAGPDKVLEGGEELTREKKKALGLKDDDIVELLQKGSLYESTARLADSSPSNPAMLALEARAEKAEADLATAKSQLHAALQRAETAEAKVTELEAKVTELDAEIAELETELSEYDGDQGDGTEGAEDGQGEGSASTATDSAKAKGAKSGAQAAS